MPIGESFSIGLTTYAFLAATVAWRAVDLMRWRLANPTPRRSSSSSPAS